MNAGTLPVRSVGGIVRAGSIAAVMVTTGNIIIYFIGSLFNISFTVPTPSNPFTITIGNVIGETLLMVVSATLVFALLRRLTLRAVWVFRVIAVIVLLISFIFPLILTVEPRMKIALGLMHLFSAIGIVGLLTRSQ